jgi:hypothetical protein
MISRSITLSVSNTDKNASEKSRKYPKITDATICRYWILAKFFRKRIICKRTSSRLNAIVNCPIVNGSPILSVYGILEVGEVPRLAFVIIPTPIELINNPSRKNR